MARPPTYPGEPLKSTSIKLTHRQQIALLRLGGARWVREQIEKAIRDQANK